MDTQQLNPIPPVLPPLSERIEKLVGPSQQVKEQPVDIRVRLLDDLYRAISDDDPDHAIAALWRLTQALELTDVVAFELDLADEH